MKAKEKRDPRYWLAMDEHLPVFMRDFHDAKDLFKAIGGGVSPDNTEISYVNGMCYVLDRFLRFMALHGYTLQKSRAPVQFKDIAQTMREWQEADVKAFSNYLKQQQERTRD